MSIFNHSPRRCPVCDSVLHRDSIRPPCPNGCSDPNGEPRLAELAGPRSGRPLCATCALREQRAPSVDEGLVPMTAAERAAFYASRRAARWEASEVAEWLDAEARDAGREHSGAW